MSSVGVSILAWCRIFLQEVQKAMHWRNHSSTILPTIQRMSRHERPRWGLQREHQQLSRSPPGASPSPEEGPSEQEVLGRAQKLLQRPMVSEGLQEVQEYQILIDGRIRDLIRTHHTELVSQTEALVRRSTVLREVSERVQVAKRSVRSMVSTFDLPYDQLCRSTTQLSNLQDCLDMLRQVYRLVQYSRKLLQWRTTLSRDDPDLSRASSVAHLVFESQKLYSSTPSLAHIRLAERISRTVVEPCVAELRELAQTELWQGLQTGNQRLIGHALQIVFNLGGGQRLSPPEEESMSGSTPAEDDRTRSDIAGIGRQLQESLQAVLDRLEEDAEKSLQAHLTSLLSEIQTAAGGKSPNRSSGSSGGTADGKSSPIVANDFAEHASAAATAALQGATQAFSTVSATLSGRSSEKTIAAAAAGVALPVHLRPRIWKRVQSLLDTVFHAVYQAWILERVLDNHRCPVSRHSFGEVHRQFMEFDSRGSLSLQSEEEAEDSASGTEDSASTPRRPPEPGPGEHPDTLTTAFWHRMVKLLGQEFREATGKSRPLARLLVSEYPRVHQMLLMLVHGIWTACWSSASRLQHRDSPVPQNTSAAFDPRSLFPLPEFRPNPQTPLSELLLQEEGRSSSGSVGRLEQGNGEPPQGKSSSSTLSTQEPTPVAHPAAQDLLRILLPHFKFLRHSYIKKSSAKLIETVQSMFTAAKTNSKSGTGSWARDPSKASSELSVPSEAALIQLGRMIHDRLEPAIQFDLLPRQQLAALHHAPAVPVPSGALPSLHYEQAQWIYQAVRAFSEQAGRMLILDRPDHRILSSLPGLSPIQTVHAGVFQRIQRLSAILMVHVQRCRELQAAPLAKSITAPESGVAASNQLLVRSVRALNTISTAILVHACQSASKLLISQLAGNMQEDLLQRPARGAEPSPYLTELEALIRDALEEVFSAYHCVLPLNSPAEIDASWNKPITKAPTSPPGSPRSGGDLESPPGNFKTIFQQPLRFQRCLLEHLIIPLSLSFIRSAALCSPVRPQEPGFGSPELSQSDLEGFQMQLACDLGHFEVVMKQFCSSTANPSLLTLRDETTKDGPLGGIQDFPRLLQSMQNSAQTWSAQLSRSLLRAFKDIVFASPAVDEVTGTSPLLSIVQQISSESSASSAEEGTSSALETQLRAHMRVVTLSFLYTHISTTSDPSHSVRAKKALQIGTSPHVVLGWDMEHFLGWLFEHTAEEALQLLETVYSKLENSVDLPSGPIGRDLIPRKFPLLSIAARIQHGIVKS